MIDASLSTWCSGSSPSSRTWSRTCPRACVTAWGGRSTWCRRWCTRPSWSTCRRSARRTDGGITTSGLSFTPPHPHVSTTRLYTGTPPPRPACFCISALRESSFTRLILLHQRHLLQWPDPLLHPTPRPPAGLLGFSSSSDPGTLSHHLLLVRRWLFFSGFLPRPWSLPWLRPAGCPRLFAVSWLYLGGGGKPLQLQRLLCRSRAADPHCSLLASIPALSSVWQLALRFRLCSPTQPAAWPCVSTTSGVMWQSYCGTLMLQMWFWYFVATK